MTDDHAAHAMGAYGSMVNKTPNMDRLARKGALLTSVFATNSICTPSRAAILTGQYAHLNGVTMFNRFDSNRMTVARLLQAGGYYTGMIGKWHLGSDPQGFDYWNILPGQGVYFNPVWYTATAETTYAGRYVTDVTTDLALDVLKNGPKGKPFFLMMHHKAPHRPWDSSDEHAAHFATQRIPEPVTFWDNYETLTGEALVRWKYQRYMQDYLATVQSVDGSVGQVLAYLDKAGLARNTLVIYTSDQGFFLGDHGLFDKRFMYEESIRMPFLVRWPTGIKPGTKSGAMALNTDFATTFLQAAGLPASADMQGRSLISVLRGRRPAHCHRLMYYRYYHDPGDHHTRAPYGVRTMTHKLIYFWKKDQWELFDLVNDPYELHNLYGQPGQEALAATLTAELARLRREMRDDDQLADVQIPIGVDGSAARLRGE